MLMICELCCESMRRDVTTVSCAIVDDNGKRDTVSSPDSKVLRFRLRYLRSQSLTHDVISVNDVLPDKQLNYRNHMRSIIPYRNIRMAIESTVTY